MYKVKKTMLQLCKSRDEGPQLPPNTSDISFCLVVPSHLQILTPDFFVNAVNTVHFHTYSSTPLVLLRLSVTWCSHYRLLDCPLEFSWQGTVKYRREKPSFGRASFSIKGAEGASRVGVGWDYGRMGGGLVDLVLNVFVLGCFIASMCLYLLF